MLEKGPIPVGAHGAIEYLAGVLFVVAPFLFGFASGAAVAVSIVTGVVVLVVAATTVGPTSLVDQIPIQAHAVLDFMVAALLIAAPFLFAFSDESAPTAFFIVLGLLHLLITIGTRFLTRGDAGPAPAGEGGARR
jgi:hypothetical protein